MKGIGYTKTKTRRLLWNVCGHDIHGAVVAAALPQFRRELKTFLFRQSYPSILL